MNFLVLTIGNSDLQFDRNELEQLSNTDYYLHKDENGEYLIFSDNSIARLTSNRNYFNWFLIRESRKDGEVLLKNIDKVQHLLHFPLIAPIIQYLKDNNIELSKIAFVYTDQQDINFRKSDTLFTKEIIKLWLQTIYPKIFFDEIGVDKVTDIDHLYPRFRNKVKFWREGLDEGSHVYLADQGGIDQINQSIRLQLLQAFKSRVHILQKAEETATKELAFPQLFIKDLIRQNIIKHVSDYDFDKVDDTLQPESWVIKLCNYASSRLMLNYSSISNIQQLSKMLRSIDLGHLAPDLEWNKIGRVKQNRIKIVDLYLAAKIAFHQKRYNEFLWRIYTVNENLTQDETDKLLGYDSMHEHFKPNLNIKDENPKWNEALNSIDSCLLPSLKAQGIYTHNPNRFSYKAIYLFLLHNGKIVERMPTDDFIQLTDTIESLSKRRNGLAHKMGTITESDIKKLIPDEDCFFSYLDTWLSVANFGLYDDIRKHILMHYE
ncbi:hypothetical protein FC093_19050 [Ilyomonas limi]|uniref:ApeA N-terminal domain-containing protein n=1 Tax=Ilyomonas limi TaxID=2575867 RepID=A0A4U3KU12_9BACT|nr:hypothetical protein [Ilyomonas limi]TKK65850.1 hypothetical protein FC093_19050 [Ilyomonas limi]